MEVISSLLGSGATASLGHLCPVGQSLRAKVVMWHSGIPRSGVGATAATCSRVSTIPSLLHHPLTTWQGFYSQLRRELSGDGRGRRRERAESHVLRACLLASPGPASSSSGRRMEWDKRTGSNLSAQAWKKYPQMKLKSRLFWPHQMLGAIQSISQCEQHLSKARDFLTDHPDLFQREMRCCCCTSKDDLLGSSQGMSFHPALSSFA